MSTKTTASDAASKLGGQRTALLALGGVALLVIGVLLGMWQGSSSAAPTADQPNAADIGFSQDMTVHHQQAVEMGTIIYDKTSDLEIKSMAYDIITSQQEQIGRMQGWLQLWGAESTAAVPMQWMTAEDHMSMHGGMEMTGSTMPGMASPEEMAQLRAAEGAEADVYFLQLMLRHHQLGIPMMTDAAENGAIGPLKELARGMAATQASENVIITDMLAKRGAQPLPAN
jgi:uncharacterized protein (DUF305 family)